MRQAPLPEEQLQLDQERSCWMFLGFGRFGAVGRGETNLPFVQLGKPRQHDIIGKKGRVLHSATKVAAKQSEPM